MWICMNNTSVDYVGHGMNNGKMVVLAKVSNHGAEVVTTDATLYGDEELLQIKTVTIQAGESEVVYFEDVVLRATRFLWNFPVRMPSKKIISVMMCWKRIK